MNNYYSSFAYYYDELTENVNYKKRADYFNSLIKKFGGTENGILLDLGCGTGSISEEMARLGYDVIGIDISDEMLSKALDKKFESGLPIQYLKQDMRNLDMFGTIDITLSALDSINHLHTLDDVIKTFQKVYLFAQPETGLFIFDVNTIYKHKYILADNAFVYDMESVYCVWQNSFIPENNEVRINLDFFEPDGDCYRRYSESFSEFAYDEAVIDKALTDVGFKILAKYDGDTFNPVHSKTERIIYIARKEV